MFRRLRFSLRTLLVVVLCIATGAAYVGWRIRWFEQQSRVTREITARGGTILVWDGGIKQVVLAPHIPYRGCGTGLKCVIEPASGTPSAFTDDDLPLLTQLYGLKVVDFTNSQVSSFTVDQFRHTYPDLVVKPRVE